MELSSAFDIHHMIYGIWSDYQSWQIVRVIQILWGIWGEMWWDLRWSEEFLDKNLKVIELENILTLRLVHTGALRGIVGQLRRKILEIRAVQKKKRP